MSKTFIADDAAAIAQRMKELALEKSVSERQVGVAPELAAPYGGISPPSGYWQSAGRVNQVSSLPWPADLYR